MKKIETVEKIRSPHVMDSIIIGESASWKECLDEWAQPMSLDKRMEWIHRAQVRSDNGERFPFLLDLADRHADPLLFKGLPGHEDSCRCSNRQYRMVNDIRQAKSLLSSLAFRALCNSLFAEMKSEGGNDRPFGIELKEPLFSKLIWFFRCTNNRNECTNLGHWDRGDLRTSVAANHYVVAKKFATSFVMDAWQMLIEEPFYRDDGGPDFTIAPPHTKSIVNLMRKCGCLDCIISGQYQPPKHLFQIMVAIACSEEGIDCSLEDLTDISVVARLLEPLVRDRKDHRDNSLAKALYLARLNF